MSTRDLIKIVQAFITKVVDRMEEDKEDKELERTLKENEYGNFIERGESRLEDFIENNIMKGCFFRLRYNAEGKEINDELEIDRNKEYLKKILKESKLDFLSEAELNYFEYLFNHTKLDVKFIISEILKSRMNSMKLY